MRSNSRKVRTRERGAALILTVVVVMILTTLALTMATFTITEERTATTYRDSLQTRSVAEAGARIVQQMFYKHGERQLVPLYSATATADDTAPTPAWDYWGADEDERETQLNEIGIWRKFRAGATTPRYTGNQNRLFDGPFKDNWGQVFGGTYDPNPTLDQFDLKFNCTNPDSTLNPPVVIPSANCWLDAKINALLKAPPPSTDVEGWNLDTGRITDISFYAPPTTGGRAYGLATVRVTATKFNSADGSVMARETIEAVIIDVTPKPAVLGNGNINFVLQAGAMCGDGCEQIHSNGNAVVGNISGGTSPMVTAVGTVSGGSGSTKPGSKLVSSPRINPWDLAYRPTSATELNRYYLVTTRAVDALFLDGNPVGNPPDRPCGLGAYTTCQDYGLEYNSPIHATAPNAAAPARTTGGTPRLYKYDQVGRGWTLCDENSPLTAGACAGTTLQFNVDMQNDLTYTPPAGTETNDIPYHPDRVPRTEFEITAKEDNATVLVDGMFYKHGSMDAIMTIVAVGTIKFHASSTWAPAMSNRTMWISGRDLDTQSNCCVPSNTCSTNLTSSTNASIIAAHEQVKNDSQTALLGLIVGENKVNGDPLVGGAALATTLNALDLVKGDHASRCNDPEWPWVMPVTPAISSMKTAAN